MTAAGLRVPRSAIAHSVAEAQGALEDVGLPLIVRPAFTLGGTGGGVVRTEAELPNALQRGLSASPIAKIAARLAVGDTLLVIPNDITRATPANFEPAIDYCVVKWPRFAFEKFPGAESGLTTHMKSVGEAMAIGRTFKQAFAKALRSRELDAQAHHPQDDDQLVAALEEPGADRFDHLL